MTILSIITINYNDAEGLRKTLASVAAQTYKGIEHVIVDGGSTDGSVEVIRAYADTQAAHAVKWVSEKDKGIYNAMNKGIEIALGKRIVNSFNRSELVEDKNKGIEIATGDYIQILNSGDMLAAATVTERMMAALANNSAILYGNMIKVNAQGKVVGKSGYTEYSLRQFYSSTLNHDCAYIRKDLFEEYGLYDEHLKIVSDWKWYLQAIGLGKVKPDYVDIDVTIFDDGGISETNIPLRNAERRQVLEELLPPAVLWDYDTHAFEMEQMKRLRRWHLYGVVYFMERVLFKLEKWFFK
jgi:glycosyltransferase involved in cell wall biosynthesis